MPKHDSFAEKKVQNDQHLLKAMDSIQLLLKEQTESTAKCHENGNSIANDYFTIIYDKMTKMSEADVNKSFLEILAILDKFQKLE